MQKTGEGMEEGFATAVRLKMQSRNEAQKKVEGDLTWVVYVAGMCVTGGNLPAGAPGNAFVDRQKNRQRTRLPRVGRWKTQG